MCYAQVWDGNLHTYVESRHESYCNIFTRYMALLVAWKIIQHIDFVETFLSAHIAYVLQQVFWSERWIRIENFLAESLKDI